MFGKKNFKSFESFSINQSFYSGAYLRMRDSNLRIQLLCESKPIEGKEKMQQMRIGFAISEEKSPNKLDLIS